MGHGNKKIETAHMSETTDKKTKTTSKASLLGMLLSLVQTLFIIGLVGLAIVTFGARIPQLSQFGLQFFAVTSGSMEPAIPTGAIISVGKYNLEELQEGDIITYNVKANTEDKPAVVTHRIHKIEKQEQQQSTNFDGETVEKNTISYTIKTKGDANSEPDTYELGPNNIIGLYKWHVPYLGFVSAYAQTAQGFIALVIVPATILIVWEITSLVLYFKKRYQDKAASEVAELKRKLAEKDEK